MFRYSREASMISSGVWIRASSSRLVSRPAITITASKIAVKIKVVDTAVFIFRYSFAPNNLDTITEHPILHPNANAIKINVIS